MSRHLVLCVLLSAATLFSCRSASPKKGIHFAWTASEVPVVDNATDLEEGVNQILSAYSLCSFSEEVRARMPLGVSGTGSWEGAEEEGCLGTLRIAQWKAESSDLVFFELVPKNKRATRKNLRIMFGRYVDGRWLFSWPAESGPELHPD